MWAFVASGVLVGCGGGSRLPAPEAPAPEAASEDPQTAACDRDDAAACFDAEPAAAGAPGLVTARAEAFARLDRACVAAPDGAACWILGRVLVRGLGALPRDPARGVELLGRACKAGAPTAPACLDYAAAHWFGIGVRMDPSVADPYLPDGEPLDPVVWSARLTESARAEARASLLAAAAEGGSDSTELLADAAAFGADSATVAGVASQAYAAQSADISAAWRDVEAALARGERYYAITLASRAAESLATGHPYRARLAALITEQLADDDARAVSASTSGARYFAAMRYEALAASGGQPPKPERVANLRSAFEQALLAAPAFKVPSGRCAPTVRALQVVALVTPMAPPGSFDLRTCVGDNPLGNIELAGTLRIVLGATTVRVPITVPAMSGTLAMRAIYDAIDASPGWRVAAMTWARDESLRRATAAGASADLDQQLHDMMAHMTLGGRAPAAMEFLTRQGFDMTSPPASTATPSPTSPPPPA